PWSQVGGTSAGVPQWAGLLALVNQGRAVNGLAPLDGRTQTLPAIYSLPTSDFHDITAGSSNGTPSIAAAAGYDLVTGRGSPVANKLVPDLTGPFVANTIPSVGAPVATPPVFYQVSFSDSIDPASVQAADFAVDGVAAAAVTLDPTNRIATFTYVANPVSAQGPHTMRIA